MVVELFGGPLDGAIIHVATGVPPYLVISNHQDEPIYKFGIGCARSRCIPYHFLGYEPLIRYEYPEKSEEIQSIEQKDVAVSDSCSGT
ncbi:MAG TPA: hypothetical protein V6C69_03230 [Trichormus sp.]|jgi:hypothetical protein